VTIEIKIGRNLYTVSKEDRFLDNGNSVQLVTQSKELSSWGKRPNPVLSKRTVKELEAYGIKQYASPYPNCLFFGIVTKSE